MFFRESCDDCLSEDLHVPMFPFLGTFVKLRGQVKGTDAFSSPHSSLSRVNLDSASAPLCSAPPAHGTGTSSALPITVVKPSNTSMKPDASDGTGRSCERCSASCQADSRAAVTFQAAIVSCR